MAAAVDGHCAVCSLRLAAEAWYLDSLLFISMLWPVISVLQDPITINNQLVLRCTAWKEHWAHSQPFFCFSPLLNEPPTERSVP